MTRQQASQMLRDELNKNGLTDWGVRLNQNAESRFLGLCSYKDKCIILSAHHIDIHPDPDVVNTIKHEVAHALCPGHGHDEVWIEKAKEIGCDNTLPCSNLSLSADVIDAIRGGADVEVTFDEQVIRTPKYKITRLQDKCEKCGVVAVFKSEYVMEVKDDSKPDLKFVTLECGHTYIRKIPKGTPFHKFQWDGDENCNHAWDKSKCLKCGRKMPYPFQLEGMRFLERGLSMNKGAAIFDEMALGKTVQAGGVVYNHPELWPVLWTVKSSLIYQTFSFIMNTMGEDHIPQIIKTSKDWLIPGLKHYIVGYDMLVPKTRTLKNGTVVNSGFDIKQFDRVGIKTVVLDECQQIKNVDSSRTQMVRRVVKDRKVIPLSGTPWNNRGSELYPVMNMMDPVKFPSYAQFRRQWVDTYWMGGFQKEGGIRNIKAFREYTKDICIRRERAEVMPDLPKVNRIKLNVVMNDIDEKNYDDAVKDFVEWYEAEQVGMGSMAIIAQMAKMRHLVANAKIPATLEYVDEFIEETDRKIVVFAHHKDVQEILFQELKSRYDRPAKPGEDFTRIPVMQHTAELSAQERFETQEKFNQAPRAIMVASQLASGEGANWQTCSDCIMHERQWNPGKEEQCEGRFPRPGTTATSINAIYAHLEGLIAIDSQLDGIIERKRIAFHNGMNKGEPMRWNEDTIMKELADAIVSGYRRKHAA